MGHKVYILIPILLPYRYTVRGTRHLFERRMQCIYAAAALRTYLTMGLPLGPTTMAV
jgi:hypothetical protein